MADTTSSNTMWGGRFASGPDAIMTAINASIDFDKRLAAQDVAASQAHAAMLGAQGIIAADDATAIRAGLSAVLEEIEAIRKGPVEAIRATGAGHLQPFVYAVLPQVRVAWAGIAIYTWDVVFRASTVVGFFGAGGMGHYLRESVQRLESRQVAAIILTIVGIVIVAELFSAWVRGRIARAVA